MKKIYIVMIIGIIHGLVYVFIIPPWQHYDEPGHFEYAWLTANRLKLPQVGDYDVNMRLAVGQSLIKSNFFGDGTLPNLTDPTEPIWIGIPQLVDPPLYYIIEAVPFFFLKGTPVNVQLYAGRIVSLIFLLLTIFSAYKLTQELTPTDHPLQWMVPLFVATLPSFVEFMAALNDFTAAIGIFSLWLWVSVKLIKQVTIKYALLLLVLTLAGLLTQRIFYPALLYFPLVILLSVLPGRIKYLAWIVALITSIGAILIVLNWNDAALWLRADDQDFPSRMQVDENTQNVFALHAKVYPDSSWGLVYPSVNPGFFQLVPADVADRLRGKTVTIGAWVWTDGEITGYGPGLNSQLQFQDNWLGFKPARLNKNPQFIAEVVQIPRQQDHLQIWLRATNVEGLNATIYFSGVVLIEGSWPLNSMPLFIDADGKSGYWGNEPFTNLARNAQFQHAWPYPKPQVIRLVTRILSDIQAFNISSFISLISDFPGTEWYTRATGDIIFNTFWAKFCWGQVPLLSNDSWLQPYRALLVITYLGIAGAVLTGYKLARQNSHELVFLLVITIVTILVALFYGVYIMGGALRYRPYFPTARYIYPAILPASLFLVLGWHGISTWLIKLNKVVRPLLTCLYLIFFLALDIFAFASVYIYFNRS